MDFFTAFTIAFCFPIWYNTGMLMYEARLTALSAATNLSTESAPLPQKLIQSAVRYLLHEIDKSVFVQRCADFPLYAQLIFYSEQKQEDCSLESFCATHKSLYAPQENAGEIRTEELMLPGGSCTAPKLLRGSLKSVLSKMAQMQGNPQVSKADFAATLCCYLRELIILSPFAYGNGVARRAFLQAFCRSRGFSLTYTAAGKKEITAAETAAFASDETGPMFSVLIKCLSYMHDDTAAPPRKTTPVTREHGSRLPSRPRRELPQRVPPAVTAQETAVQDAVRELREVQKTLDTMSARVGEILSSLQNKQ